MVEVSIGSNQYKFFTLETRAWLADGENAKQMVKDMKNSRSYLDALRIFFGPPNTKTRSGSF